MRSSLTATGWITLALVPICASLLYTLLFPEGPFYLLWVDGLTYSSLIMMMAGGCVLIRNGRFFFGFVDSCKRFLRSFRKKESFIREQEGRRADPVYHQTKWSSIPFLLVGFFYFVLSLILSIVYLS